jgi:hypothetical protein
MGIQRIQSVLNNNEIETADTRPGIFYRLSWHWATTAD